MEVREVSRRACPEHEKEEPGCVDCWCLNGAQPRLNFQDAKEMQEEAESLLEKSRELELRVKQQGVEIQILRQEFEAFVIALSAQYNK